MKNKLSPLGADALECGGWLPPWKGRACPAPGRSKQRPYKRGSKQRPYKSGGKPPHSKFEG